MYSMDKNVGTTDRDVRTVVGAVAGTASLAILAGFVSFSEIVALALGIVAIAALGTAATGTCGLYSLLGVDTCSARSGGSR
jgi:hypothetical protein